MEILAQKREINRRKAEVSLFDSVKPSEIGHHFKDPMFSCNLMYKIICIFIAIPELLLVINHESDSALNLGYG